MKRWIPYLFILIVISGCDEIEGPYSVSQNTNPVDTTGGGANIRKVLLEDYTGHKCQGCPAAHEEARLLKNIFGDSLIVLTIHANTFWTSTNASGPFTYNFRTTEATELYDALIPSTEPFPTGTINRKMNGVNRVVAYPKWGGKIDTLLNEPQQAKIKITPSWDASGRTISAEITTTFLADITGDINLSIYYSEDSIINWQAFPLPATNQSDYVHRHVLRGALSGTWGSLLVTNAVNGSVHTTSATGSAIAADIVPEHVYIVAVLFNNTSREVIQAEEKKLLQ